MKKNAGFTLVELIVVIAILAILAGIAIPVYSGYISKANKAADLQQLDSIKTAAVFAATEADADHDIVVEKIEYTENTTVVTVNDATEPTSIADFVPAGGIELKTGSSATWEDGEWDIAE